MHPPPWSGFRILLALLQRAARPERGIRNMLYKKENLDLGLDYSPLYVNFCLKMHAYLENSDGKTMKDV